MDEQKKIEAGEVEVVSRGRVVEIAGVEVHIPYPPLPTGDGRIDLTPEQVEDLTTRAEALPPASGRRFASADEDEDDEDELEQLRAKVRRLETERMVLIEYVVDKLTSRQREDLERICKRIYYLGQ